MINKSFKTLHQNWHWPFILMALLNVLSIVGAALVTRSISKDYQSLFEVANKGKDLFELKEALKSTFLNLSLPGNQVFTSGDWKKEEEKLDLYYQQFNSDYERLLLEFQKKEMFEPDFFETYYMISKLAKVVQVQGHLVLDQYRRGEFEEATKTMAIMDESSTIGITHFDSMANLIRQNEYIEIENLRVTLLTIQKIETLFYFSILVIMMFAFFVGNRIYLSLKDERNKLELAQRIALALEQDKDMVLVAQNVLKEVVNYYHFVAGSFWQKVDEEFKLSEVIAQGSDQWKKKKYKISDLDVTHPLLNKDNIQLESLSTNVKESIFVKIPYFNSLDAKKSVSIPLGEKFERLGVVEFYINEEDIDSSTIEDIKKFLHPFEQLLKKNKISRDLLEVQKYLLQQKMALDTSAIVAATDIKGKIISVNQKFIEISGYTQSELLGQDHRILNSGFHDKKFFKNLWSTILSGKIWKGEIKNLRRDGSYYWVDSNIIPIKNGKGDILQFLSIRYDITERKAVEETLAKEKINVVKALEVKSKFIANVGHEIRTPLNGVIGAVELLETYIVPQGREYFEVLKSNGQYLLSVVSDILDFSNLEENDIKLSNTEESIKEVVEALLPSFRENISKNGIKFNYLPSPLDEQIISIDKRRLRQVLIHLLSNAYKYTTQGQITLEITSTEISPKQIEYVIDVKDTGQGIGQDDQKNLFDSFYQVNTQSKTKNKGVGLGLAICKKIAKAFGGDLTVSSQEGLGTTFSLHFMAQRVIKRELEEKKDESLFSQNTGRQNMPRIILADDNQTNRLLGKRFFEKLGLKVELAENGQEVLDLLANGPCDIIFMDAHMPVMDGFEATRAIRKKYQSKESPWIIAFSAGVDDEGQNQCFDSGMNDFLMKPFSLDDLKNVLDRVPKASPSPEEKEDQAKELKVSINREKKEQLDINTLLEHFAGDEDILVEVAQKFLQTKADLVEKIKVALEQKNAADLKITAHTLKGVVSHFLVKNLRLELQKLEDMGKNGNLDGADQLFVEVQDQVNDLEFQLDQFTKTRKVG